MIIIIRLLVDIVAVVLDIKIGAVEGLHQDLVQVVKLVMQLAVVVMAVLVLAEVVLQEHLIHLGMVQVVAMVVQAVFIFITKVKELRK